jgi:hypothetical protein
MKKVLVVGVMIAAILAMAVPGHAAGVVLTTNAKATLPLFPGSGNVSSLTGSVTGAGNGQPSGALGLGSGGVSYNETTCAEGTASGNITIGSSGNLALTWIRVGATAVLRLTGGGQQGVAAAVFTIPAGSATNCLPGGAGPITASIIAVGVAAP